MPVQIRKGARRHLYIDEWYEYRGVNDEKVANRLGMHRETIHRWRKQQHRLRPGKIAMLASALDCEPEDLWQLPPPKISLDAMLKEADANQRELAFDLVQRIMKKAK